MVVEDHGVGLRGNDAQRGQAAQAARWQDQRVAIGVTVVGCTRRCPGALAAPANEPGLPLSTQPTESLLDAILQRSGVLSREYLVPGWRGEDLPIGQGGFRRLQQAQDIRANGRRRRAIRFVFKINGVAEVRNRVTQQGLWTVFLQCNAPYLGPD